MKVSSMYACTAFASTTSSAQNNQYR